MRISWAAEYKLHHKCENGRGVYTFCMCPGGEIIDSSSEPETAVTNGMSGSARDGAYANSGLLVDVKTEDFRSEDPLAGIAFQKSTRNWLTVRETAVYRRRHMKNSVMI